MLKHSRIPALLLMLALVLQPHPLQAQPDGQTQVISVDAPAANATVGGVVLVTGWAIDPSASAGTGVDQVHVYVDGVAGAGKLLGAAKYGNRRPDVAAARGGDRFAASGFEYSWDTMSVAPGPHTLYVYAHNTAGEWGYMELPVVVSPERTGPNPPAGSTTPGTPPGSTTPGTPPSTTPPGPPATTRPPSGTSTTPPATTSGGAAGSRTNPSVGVAPTSGLPRATTEHPTDDNIDSVISVTPLPPGIRWSETGAEFDEEEEVSIVLLGLLANDRVNTWLTLPVAEQEKYLRQLMVNLGEVYTGDDAFLVGVVLRLQVPKREDIPSFVQDRYIRPQPDGTFRATWPDVISGYVVASGKMVFKSARMSSPGPALTE